jgi:hypothetical protein
MSRGRASSAAIALAVVASVPSVASAEVVAAKGFGAPAEVPFWRRIEAHGYVDVYASYNANRPADGASFLPGTGTTAKRAGELGLSQAALGVSLDPAPVGFALAVHLGTGPTVLHETEPAVPGLGGGAWTLLQRASVAGKIPIGRGLLVEAGILPSHLGFEAFASKDNWTYTRSWTAEYSPYFETGIKLELEVAKGFTAALYGVNGWQTIGDVNHGKSVGARLAYEGDRVTVALGGLAGPEQPSDDRHVRALADLWAVVRATRWLSLAACVDVAVDHLDPKRAPAPGEDTSGRRPSAVGWYGVAGYARVAVAPFLAVAARGEVFGDPHGAISAYGQRLAAGTLTIEGRPHDAIVLKLEGRYDRSTEPVFGLSTLLASSTPDRGRDQALVALGAVAKF